MARSPGEEGGEVKHQTHEYRVLWQREGGKPRARIFQSERGARRLVTFMGPEPWKALGKEPDAPYCCSRGPASCGCGGKTNREHFLGQRGGERGITPLVSCAVERRAVGAWESPRA